MCRKANRKSQKLSPLKKGTKNLPGVSIILKFLCFSSPSTIFQSFLDDKKEIMALRKAQKQIFAQPICTYVLVKK